MVRRVCKGRPRLPRGKCRPFLACLKFLPECFSKGFARILRQKLREREARRSAGETPPPPGIRWRSGRHQSFVFVVFYYGKLQWRYVMACRIENVGNEAFICSRLMVLFCALTLIRFFFCVKVNFGIVSHTHTHTHIDAQLSSPLAQIACSVFHRRGWQTVFDIFLKRKKNDHKSHLRCGCLHLPEDVKFWNCPYLPQ